MDMKEILNKNIIDVIGPVKAKAFQLVNAQVMAAFAPETRVYTFETAGSQQSLRISRIPLDGAQDHEPAVLMVSDDITDLVEERERRESSMSELIQLLMIIVN
jgi:nitrogen fixation/metabolism regulation signal transduction histidine kinase